MECEQQATVVEGDSVTTKKLQKTTEKSFTLAFALCIGDSAILLCKK